MHFHENEMRSRRSARAIRRRFHNGRPDVARNVPEHVTSGLANVTLHPRAGRLIRQIIVAVRPIYLPGNPYKTVIGQQ